MLDEHTVRGRREGHPERGAMGAVFLGRYVLVGLAVVFLAGSLRLHPLSYTSNSHQLPRHHGVRCGHIVPERDRLRHTGAAGAARCSGRQCPGVQRAERVPRDGVALGVLLCADAELRSHLAGRGGHRRGRSLDDGHPGAGTAARAVAPLVHAAKEPWCHPHPGLRGLPCGRYFGSVRDLRLSHSGVRIPLLTLLVHHAS
mmetsp:Transcript_82114/g.229550  ORF Transcript_82114/g.229550 Transcript_82114/m.229550 type:complete len:200 (-) Transcript_82114:167-766(-)